MNLQNNKGQPKKDYHYTTYYVTNINNIPPPPKSTKRREYAFFTMSTFLAFLFHRNNSTQGSISIILVVSS